MTIHLTIEVSCESWADVESFHDYLRLNYPRHSVESDSTGHVEPQDEIDDDEIGPDDVITVLRGMQSHMTHSNAGMRAIDEIISLVGAPDRRELEHRHTPWSEIIDEAVSRDDAPPHGIERVNPTSTGPLAREVKAHAISAVACPTCNQPAGKACTSSRKPEYGTYGTGHVHAARLDAYYALKGQS